MTKALYHPAQLVRCMMHVSRGAEPYAELAFLTHRGSDVAVIQNRDVGRSRAPAHYRVRRYDRVVEADALSPRQDSCSETSGIRVINFV